MAVAPKAKPVTVNETLRDRGIAHAVYLEKLKSTEAAAVLAHYRDEVVPDLVERLTKRLARIESRGIDTRPADTQRLKDLLELMQETVDAWSTGLSADLTDRATDIGVAEVTWQDDLFKRVLPFAWDTVVPATAMVKAAVLNSPIDGVLLEDIVGKLGAATKANLERAIRIGITEGETIDQMVARIGRVTDLSGNSAVAVTRTAVQHASTAGREAFFADNTDLIASVQWHATLDTRTCSSCGALDGQKFEVGKGPRSPRHILCRCTMVPVVKSMRELGFDLADFDQTTRASMNGQVPAATTFNDWLRRMPASMQDEALGPSRGALFRTGEVSVTDFVNREGDQITLDQLRKREAAAFKSAGL